MGLTTLWAGRRRNKTILVAVVCCLLLFFLKRGIHNIRGPIISAELTTQAYPGLITVRDSRVLHEIRDQVGRAEIHVGSKQIKSNYKLVLREKTKTQTYFFEQPAVLVQPQTGRWLALKDNGRCLDPLMKQLAARNPFGEFLPWNEVDNIFRKYDLARVMDYDSGQSFVVQRRAGKLHADVQPVSPENSAVMKRIYGGRWSWKRRAVIVEVNGHRIAASMNGMPHGAGSITGNDFAGHFCIHFRESKTHSGDNDVAHQLMVWKAAGMVPEMLAEAGPDRIIRVFLTALEQGDFNLAGGLSQASPDIDEREIIRRLGTVKWLAVAKISKPQTEKDCQRFTLKVSYGLKDGIQVQNRQVIFTVIRNAGKIPWKITAQSITRWLDNQKETGAKEPGQNETV